MNELDIIKQKAMSDLLTKGWNESDLPIRKLESAMDLEEVWYALYYVAEHIGRDEGWGEEGIGELHNELAEMYWEGEVPEF